PIDADKASFKQGDFSGQFVAFGAYQYDRFTTGEVPLWNPYNNSGLLFIADTQAATFYPPRLLTIALARLAGGWSYHALELEAIFHVLGYTLAMFALVRRLTDSTLGGLVGAIVGGYGGYMSGYPPLQLALLEAGVWLPLVILGISEAIRLDGVRWRALALAGLALGVSWLAGHPQTSFFLTYLAIAYLGFRLWSVNLWSWRRFAQTLTLLGIVTFGITAVTFLPGVEYLAATARSGMGYASKTNGFPLQDIIQFVYPGVVSLFSPLYIGVVGLVFVIAALGQLKREIVFWLVVAAFGLVWSFGGNTAFFDAIYNLMPGLRFFRGQERSAYLVGHSLAIVAGFGVVALSPSRRLRWLMVGLLSGFGIISLLWLGFPNDYANLIDPAALTAVVILGVWGSAKIEGAGLRQTALIGLLVFELFSVNMGADSNYDDIPPADQLSMTPPQLVQPVLPRDDDIVRVDGFRGLTDNYGSLYGVYDARGISPLFLDGPFQLQEPPFASQDQFEINPMFWELNAVEYVYSGFETLPVDSEIIAIGGDRFGPVNLHRLSDPRPFAHLIYRSDVVDSDGFARALLADPAYVPRDSVILNTAPGVVLPETAPTDATASVTAFKPESFTVAIDTPENAIVTLAHPHYRGWNATLDEQPVSILRAYGAFTAVAVPAGSHTLTLSYNPLSYRIGTILSLATWAGVVIIGVIEVMAWRRTHANDIPR
ncbi:MAG: YfhO family protein, partial [Chloroflexota bacterium]